MKKLLEKEVEDFLTEWSQKNDIKPIRIIGGEEFIKQCKQALRDYAKGLKEK